MIEDESRANLEVAPVQQGYARWSETYDVQDNPLIILEEPLVRSLQGEVQGLKVADIGCGTGRHTVQLSEAGARVTAIDFAPEMMAQAIEKTKDQEVRFVTHDLTERFPFDSDAFDRVLCCLVLEHIPDLEPSDSRDGEDLSAGWLRAHFRASSCDVPPPRSGPLYGYKDGSEG